MSNIGATTGKEPDFIEDIDLLSMDQLRGAYKDMHKAKLSLNEKATVEGVMTTLKTVRQAQATQAEQMNRLIGMYQTLQNQFDQYQQARVRELNVRVNGGSTTPEDYDGADARSGN